MVVARTTATMPDTLNKVGVRRCSSAPLNSVVLPPVTPDGAVPVYILTPQATSNSFPIGGHYRIDIAADGSIAGSRAFAKSCIALDREQGGAKAAMLFITHVLDPQPTEIHVWTSLASNMPLAVAIVPSGDVWLVADGHLSYQYTLLPQDRPGK